MKCERLERKEAKRTKIEENKKQTKHESAMMQKWNKQNTKVYEILHGWLDTYIFSVMCAEGGLALLA